MYQSTPLNQVIDQLKRRYGNHIIRIASQMQSDFHQLGTGVAALGSLLDGGGVLVGYLNEFTGQPTSGATSVVHLTIGHIQRQGYEVVYIDLEQCFDPISGIAHGITLEKLLIVHPVKTMYALKLIRDIAIQRIPCLIILDSGNIPLGNHFNRLELRLAQSPTCVVTLTHMPSRQSQVEITFKRKLWIYRGKDVVGYRIKAQLNKHPNLVPVATEFDLRFQAGGRDA